MQYFVTSRQLTKTKGEQWSFFGSVGMVIFFWVTQPSPLTDFQPPDHCFQWFFDGFGVIPPLVSMVMDNWSDNAMVLMDHSPLNFHKIENFKLADPAVEGDPKIWHRSFWLSAVTLNKHKSMCALPLPPDLQLAGDIFGSSEWCSCLCWEVDSSCTKKI